MNRRIYFNDKFIEFIDNTTQSSQDQLIKSSANEGKKESEKKLKKITEDFLSSEKKDPVIIHDISFEKALEILKPSFYYIEAAGGFIQKDDKFLFIRRHDRWDLPKGKLEKNETVQAAAVRECEEECGIKELRIIRPLSSTFHIYQYKKGYALKQSFWFYMQTSYSEVLTPQIEESITEVRWFTPGEIESVILKDTYYTISDVTHEGLKA